MSAKVLPIDVFLRLNAAIDSRNHVEKDCECGTHEGPHYLHMDRLDYERNRPLLNSGTFLGAMGWAREEAARLQRKRYGMEAYERWLAGRK